MVVRVAEIFFRENLSLVLHAVRIVDKFSDLTCLHLDTLALLRYDILVDALINLDIIALQRVLPTFVLFGLPVIHSTHHLIVWSCEVLVVVRCRRGATPRMQTLLVVRYHGHGIRPIDTSCLKDAVS